MDKTRIIPIVLLVILVIVSAGALKLYNEKQTLAEQNNVLQVENSGLISDNQQMQDDIGNAKKQVQTLEDRVGKIQSEMQRLEQENATLQEKYQAVVSEREELSQTLQQKPKLTISSPTTVAPPAGMPSEEYWVDFVKSKAELEAQVGFLSKQIIDYKTKVADLERRNKEISMRVDDFQKEQERLEDIISFKSRTIDIMSRDLVNEREQRGKIMEDLDDLRKENVQLKQDLVLANKDKIELQKELKTAFNEKDFLESRISEIEQVLREKSMSVEELQKQLGISIGDDISKQQETSVELPPIVVEPEVAAPDKPLQGEIISIIPGENLVVIDLGESSGVKPGMKLSVTRGDKRVAIVEIIETRREVSAAEIKDGIASEILEGDNVISE